MRDLWTSISMRRRSQRPQPQLVNTTDTHVYMNILTCTPFLLISWLDDSKKKLEMWRLCSRFSLSSLDEKAEQLAYDQAAK